VSFGDAIRCCGKTSIAVTVGASACGAGAPAVIQASGVSY